MAAWVLLLRGVGGRTQVSPRLLRAVLGAEGFGRVDTRVRVLDGSGVVADASGSKASVARAIIDAVAERIAARPASGIPAPASPSEEHQ